MTVQGARSPRFALWKRMTIRNRFGVPYLERLRIVDTPWFGVYLHRIKGPDPQPDPHDHPWDFTSIVLAGGYTEEVYRAQIGEMQPYSRRWLVGSFHTMRGDGVAHRILTAEPHTITLILRRKRFRDWGFWTIENGYLVGWTSWKEYDK